MALRNYNDVEKILKALGEASLCWSEKPAGKFDSNHAVEIAKNLYEDLFPVKAYSKSSSTEINSGTSDEGSLGEFGKKLTVLINQSSLEGRSNTPDFVLSAFLTNCLRGFERATRMRQIDYASQGDGPDTLGRETAIGD